MSGAVELGDDFARLVYFDRALLQAEFDEIIAAEFPSAARPKPRLPGCTATTEVSGRLRRFGPVPRSPATPATAGDAGMSHQSRQRSPPVGMRTWLARQEHTE